MHAPLIALSLVAFPTAQATKPAPPAPAEMSGYMLVPVERAPEEFHAGFSLYAAAFPVVERYPGSRFQTGLFGTWMFPQFAEGEKPKDLYTDIEGGLGWWRDTRFATATPKFIMGGVAVNFAAWANGPGAGKGRDWDRPLGKYAIAQLSPWVVWPPDGLNLAQGTCGELFGYGYLPLPLVEARAAGEGRPVPTHPVPTHPIPTGDQCWTLFLNSVNFKGPLCFFLPNFWTEHVGERRELVGKLLDTRPSDPNKAFQMETQWVPAAVAEHDGALYGRVAPMSFPLDKDGRTVVLHRLSVYSGAALTDAVRAWFAGGAPASGAFDAKGTFVQTFGSGGGSTWRLFADGTADGERRDIDWRAFGTPVAHDAHTFGYAWNEDLVREVRGKGGRRVRLPEYFRLETGEGRETRWKTVERTRVPRATKLDALEFDTPVEEGEGPYTTPDAADSPFRAPGPVAGPFKTMLGDGSTVTYCWYRFADQPAMIASGLTAAEREEAQRRVELLHRAWTKDREYIPAPTTGRLASIDAALLVTPPKGLEIGHVPIAIRQERRSAPTRSPGKAPAGRQ